MAQWFGRSRRKPSGGRLRPLRKKRKFEIGREKQYTTIGKQKVKLYRVRGAHRKACVLVAEVANVVDKATKKVVRSKIITVKENPANPHYVQRNIITKGCLIQTEAGMARVTSRPGQDGVINAVLVSE